MQLWQQTGKAPPFVMAELTRTVHVVAPPPDDGGGCGCATGAFPAPTRATAGGFASLVAVALCVTRRRRGRRRR